MALFSSLPKLFEINVALSFLFVNHGPAKLKIFILRFTDKLCKIGCDANFFKKIGFWVKLNKANLHTLCLIKNVNSQY